MNQREQELQALIAQLKNADAQDEVLFRNLLLRTVELTGISNKVVADRFGISLSTVERWKNGTTYPHHACRPAVYECCVKELQKAMHK